MSVHARTLAGSSHRRRAAAVTVSVLAAALGGTYAAAQAQAAPTTAATAGTGTLRTVQVYDYAKQQTAEHVTIAPDGTRYVSLGFGGQLEVEHPGGPSRILTFPGAGAGTFIGAAVVAPDGAVYVSVGSADPAVPGVWTVAPDGTLARYAALPSQGSELNGMAMDSQGNLYVADSNLGRIYRVPTRGPAAGTGQTWVQSQLLDPVAGQILDGIAFPGANGVAVFRGSLYVSNSAQENILSIPLARDGSPGPIRIAYPGIISDDIAFDVQGNLYTTTDPFETVNRVAPDGTVTVLANSSDGLTGPSSVAFGTGRDRTTLFITDLGVFSTPHISQLQSIKVGIPGAPVR
jgi:sugar lactone lactonase YvrE